MKAGDKVILQKHCYTMFHKFYKGHEFNVVEEFEDHHEEKFVLLEDADDKGLMIESKYVELKNAD